MEIPLAFPSAVTRATGAVSLAAPVFMVAVHAVMVALAAQRTSPPQGRGVLAPLLVGAFLAGWLGLAMTTADGTHFPLPSERLRWPINVATWLLPFIAAVVALLASKTMRAINLAMPPSWLIMAQTYRVLGAFFLYPFMYYGLIPGGFAWPAGVGDVLIGGLAPLIAYRVARGRPRALAVAAVWNVLGMIDLLVAPASAVMSGAKVFNIYPLALIPLFIGPPLGLLTHIYSLRNLAHARRSESSFGSDVVPAPAG
jgi:hypothetical protein